MKPANNTNQREREGGSGGIAEENSTGDSNKISRRNFLKIIGAVGTSLALGGLAFLSFRQENNNNHTNNSNNNYSAAAQTFYGSWQLGGQTHATAIHAAALTNGKVIYVAGSGFYAQNELGPFQQGIYDPATNTSQALPNISEDMFCVGHNMLPNGNVLFTGGTLAYDTRSANGKWLGLKGAWIYDTQSNVLRRIASMKHGRWYPTQVLLADGKVLVVGGYDEYGVYNKLTEIFDPATETWSIKYDPSFTSTYCAGEGEDPAIMPGAGQPCYGPGVAPNILLYPRMHLMPNGLVAVVGQIKTMRTFNPATGEWKFAGNMLLGGSRGYGTSVLLPLQNTTTEKGNILIFGGTVTADSFATTTAEIVTPNGTALQPRWTAPLAFGRKHPIPVIMPDGKILAIGGTAYQNSGANKIMAAELFDPVAETWTTLSAMTVPRLYHSVGLLLRDGRVWVAGTTPSRTMRELRVEYFVPSYYSAARPTISSTPTVGGYGQTITIPTPDAQSITAVSLVMMSTETHAGNMDQRLVWLQIQSKTSTQIVVSAPINSNIAPPSYYYLHVLKQGVPSVAAIVKIPGNASAAPPPPSGNYVSIYSVTGVNSYGTMASTGASTDVTGIGEKVSSMSSLVGSPIKRVAIVLKKSGNPTGVINVRIRNSSGAIVKEIGQIQASDLTTADKRFEVTASSSAHTLQANDVVLVEWEGTASLSDIVSVKRTAADAFNASNTHFVARKRNGTYTNSLDRDMAGDWYKEV